MGALNNITYGLYVLTANYKKQSGCVINTLMQVTSNPNKISITINKDNYTTHMIEKTGVFNVSILTNDAKFELIERFGFVSGKDKDKFEGFVDFELAKNGVAYLTKHANAYLSAKVISSTDVGSHITFLAEITEDVVLNETPSVTYAYYLENIKKKPEIKTESKVVHVCKICGYVYEGDPLPEDFVCPLCKHGAEDFERKVLNEAKEEKKEMKKYVCPVCGYSVEAEEKPENCIICKAEMVEEKK